MKQRGRVGWALGLGLVLAAVDVPIVAAQPLPPVPHVAPPGAPRPRVKPRRVAPVPRPPVVAPGVVPPVPKPARVPKRVPKP